MFFFSVVAGSLSPTLFCSVEVLTKYLVLKYKQPFLCLCCGFKGTFLGGKYVYKLSCQTLDEKIDITLMTPE